jgi:hypothetical protein
MIDLASPFDAVSLVLRVASVGVAISSAELLSRPADLRRPGLLSGDIQLTRHWWLVQTRLRGLVAVLTGGGTLAVIAIRLAAALALVVGAGTFEVARVGAIAVAVTVLALRIRSPLGVHASGTMTLVVFVAAALGLAVGSSRAITISLWFIAAQGLLAYLVAGATKLREPAWRQGRAIPAIVATTMWGNRRDALLLRAHPRASFVLCWMTMVGECAVPLALVVPLPVTVAILAYAAGFHLLLAYEMGLNSFVWAFPATYPAILYCWYFLHGSHR